MTVNLEVVFTQRCNHNRFSGRALLVCSRPKSVSYLTRQKTTFCDTLEAPDNDPSCIHPTQRDHRNRAATNARDHRALRLRPGIGMNVGAGVKH